MARIVSAYHRVAEQSDLVIVLGTDFTDVTGPTEFSFNARVAANLSAPMVLVNNLMAIRIGDMTVHGGSVIVGLPTVLIGG